MAKGLASSAGSYSKKSTYSPQSARVLIDGRENQNLDHSIKQAFQLHSGKQVKAFVVMALDEDGNVVTHTTNHVQHGTDGIFARDAEECLRIAHKTSISQARPDRDLNDRSASSNVVSKGFYRNDDLIRIDTPQQNQEAFHISSPASVRNFGSASGWHSDAESSEPSHGQLTPEAHASGLSHARNRPAKPQYLLIRDSAKVEEFLERALRTMQQLAVKRIAKAWIKGICPKKQAMFPYHKKKRERQGPNCEPTNQPGWWPEQPLCKFVEPDHIRRDERINLCIHLLRLSPTPAQLKEWNKGCVEPHQTHVTRGWTEFLKELAPPSIFDEMREPNDKTEKRQKLLAQAYDLARREEGYKDGDIDGDDRFYWHNEGLSKATPKRKVRRSYDESIDESDIDSLAESGPPAKKWKRTSVATTPAGSPPTILPREVEVDDNMQDCKPHVVVEPFTHIGTIPEIHSRSASAASSHHSWTQDAKNPHLLMPMHEQIQASQGQSQSYSPIPPWAGTSMPNTFGASLDGTGQPMHQVGLPLEGPTSTYPGRHDYQFPQQNADHAAARFRSPYVEHQVTQPQLVTLTTGSAIYTPPVMAPLVYAGNEHYHNNNNNAMYYGQPDNGQSQLFAVPGPDSMNAQFNYTAPPNTPFTNYSSGPEQCYTVDPASSYQYHPETDQTSYPMSGPRHGGAFQAPARVERGFTGHGSGVGGGAHT